MQTKAFILRPDIGSGGIPHSLRSGETPDGELAEPLRSHAKEAGLVMRRASKVSYTLPSLQATKYAAEKGAEIPFHRALYKAYWEEGLDLESRDVLMAKAKACGLDADELDARLNSDHYLAVVEQEYQEALDLGINGIPAFRMGPFLFTGAQPYEFFRQVAQRVLSRDTSER